MISLVRSLWERYKTPPTSPEALVLALEHGAHFPVDRDDVRHIVHFAQEHNRLPALESEPMDDGTVWLRRVEC